MRPLEVFYIFSRPGYILDCLARRDSWLRLLAQAYSLISEECLGFV